MGYATWFFFLVQMLLIDHITMASPQDLQEVQLSRSAVLHVMDHFRYQVQKVNLNNKIDSSNQYKNSSHVVALHDCVKLYEEAEFRLAMMASRIRRYSHDDGAAWLSAALALHGSCVEGLKEKDLLHEGQEIRNLSIVLEGALASFRQRGKTSVGTKGSPRGSRTDQSRGILASWDAAFSKPNLVVAQDGSGNFRTIKEAVAALDKKNKQGPERKVIYVKSGVYNEQVEIGKYLKNVMIVGDGIDKTIITGHQNFKDGSSTFSSATFGVSGDGFWARDMTFENTAEPEKHQAVALRVSADLSIFYRCSFKGHQDTLLVHSLRQFYRDCQIHGIIDFIFGDASAVFQNCDIFVRRPMSHQSNMITAQGRDSPNEPTGISIINSRVRPAPGFGHVKQNFKSYLGRPWKRYSRTVFIKTDLDGLIDPRGWKEWDGDFALSTLYYGEYMNTGDGASTENRVKWGGFHVMRDPKEATAFSAGNFIQGDNWVPQTGVPYSSDI